jgi:hypothetical protein
VQVIEPDEASECGRHMKIAIEVEHERQPFTVELQRDVIGRHYYDCGRARSARIHEQRMTDQSLARPGTN